jgi:hypothetical protein
VYQAVYQTFDQYRSWGQGKSGDIMDPAQHKSNCNVKNLNIPISTVANKAGGQVHSIIQVIYFIPKKSPVSNNLIYDKVSLTSIDENSGFA